MICHKLADFSIKSRMQAGLVAEKRPLFSRPDNSWNCPLDTGSSEIKLMSISWNLNMFNG